MTAEPNFHPNNIYTGYTLSQLEEIRTGARMDGIRAENKRLRGVFLKSAAAALVTIGLVGGGAHYIASSNDSNRAWHAGVAYANKRQVLKDNELAAQKIAAQKQVDREWYGMVFGNKPLHRVQIQGFERTPAATAANGRQVFTGSLRPSISPK